jgi:hypothetical protein
VEIGEVLKGVKEMVADHEKRIRLLERIAGYGIGALGFAKLLWDILHK